MRPKEFWEKQQNDGDGKRKRTGSSRKQRPESRSAPAASNYSDGTMIYSDGSSPAGDSGQVDGLDTQPDPPATTHRRASSDQLSSPQKKNKSVDDASALAALERAIKSSPHRFAGSERAPIEVENLTPKPTRRLLFPSPSQSRESRSKHSSVIGSGSRPSKHQSLSCDSVATDAQADKENCPPTEDGGMDHVSHEEHSSNTRPQTPTSPSPSRALIFKTPIKSPRRLPPTTGDFFSSAAKALLRAPSTPKRNPNRDTQPLGELTPFTAHLNQLLSETNNGSPGSQNFDFPSLPSLRNTPGCSTRTIDFDFSHFDSQDLLSTDVPMPSSPPAWFGVYEDSTERGTDSLCWGDYEPPPASTLGNEESEASQDPKTPGLIVDENGRASIEFQATA